MRKNCTVSCAAHTHTSFIVVLPSKLVQWLRDGGEHTAANRLEKYWTGDCRHWTKAHGGVGGVNNNNGTEGRWGGLKKFVCGNSGSTAGQLCLMFYLILLNVLLNSA